MRYKAVLFDIDDTLVKTWQVKWRQHKWVAKYYYDIELTDDILREHWGKPFDAMVEAMYQGRGTIGDRRAHFARHELDFPKEYHPDTQAVLGALHATPLTLGLVTSMHWEGALIDLHNLAMPLEYFAILQGSDATEFHKPDPRVFDPAKKILSDRGISSGVVYVGDALSDYSAARGAGFDFIGVTTGFVDEGGFRSAGATSVISRLSQLPQLVAG